MDPPNVLGKFKVCSEVLGGVANPNYGKEAAIGVEDGTVQKSIGEFL